jgi:membrane fusion protein, multidrug efflux system
MEDQIKKDSPTVKNNLWLRRIWALLPFTTLILLIGVVIVLQSWIRSEGNIIQQQKAKEISEKKPPVNVVTLDLTPSPIREQTNLPGVVRPWVELTIVAEVRGKIVSKKIDEGQKVTAGDVIAKIDKRSYQNAYNSAKAAFHAAKADYERTLALNRDRLATQSQLDDTLARMESGKANMDTAALDLERCMIEAPMDGIVDKVYIESGQFMNDADPIAHILRIDRVKVEVSIPESDVDSVRNVNDFTVTIGALNKKVFSGRRHYLSKSAQTLARTYLLEVAIDNPNGEILPDMFTRVNIVKREVKDGLAVPLFSLINNHGSKAVFVVDNGIARLTPIKTGIQEGWQVQAADGLKPGAKVIVVGHKDVKDGAPVEVLRTISDSKELMQ